MKAQLGQLLLFNSRYGYMLMKVVQAFEQHLKLESRAVYYDCFSQRRFG